MHHLLILKSGQSYFGRLNNFFYFDFLKDYSALTVIFKLKLFFTFGLANIFAAESKLNEVRDSAETKLNEVRNSAE